MATPYNKMTPEQKKRVNATNKRWKKRNPDKAARYKRKHYMDNRAKYLTLERDRVYRKMYGISLNKYNEMLWAQNGLCAICGTDRPTLRPSKFNFLSVDHCHKTGRVRGLLCVRCNSALGWFEAHADRAIMYVRKR